jgi:phage shock protein PspC (stress-responsive transcriptional regulator)
MKKVININFQGRVIPIEETAYDILKEYIESLRRYFANEEGREEIINDIESRIGELFAERLKKGSTCITDADVNNVIAGMGRPEELEAEGAESSGSTGQQQAASGSQTSSGSGGALTWQGRGRLYRNADDKIIAGVASGLANYLGIDPVIMRIVFVLLFGALFWVYILLWIIVPSKSVQSNITKRLYRSEDDKIIGGVCGGLAAYFNIGSWVPRLIFALPLVIGLISGPFNWWWHDWDIFWGPKIITGSLGTTLFFVYIILWIAVPVAHTSAEKLEMRGERVDVNSIRNTVKEDLESFKAKAQNWGNEVRQTAQQFGERARDWGRTASSQAKTYAEDVGPAVRRSGSGLGHAIGVLFKAFFLFIGSMIALALFAAFVAILFGGYAFFPLKDFLLEGTWQNTLGWLTLVLFFGVPLLGLITWLVRRIIGVQSRNHYLGYVFGGLWMIGLFSLIFLVGTLGREFKTRSAINEEVNVGPVNANRLLVDVDNTGPQYYGSDWFGIDWDDDWPFYGVSHDTLMLSSVRVEVVKSTDNDYHISTIKFSRGSSPQAARNTAQKIRFNPVLKDSALLLPRGFPISREDKFRNQQVMVRIEVPVGKRIMLDRSISHYDWIEIRYNRRGFDIDIDDRWEWWSLQTGVEYVMTPEGLKKVSDLDPRELGRGNYVPLKNSKSNNSGRRDSSGRYRYRSGGAQKDSDEAVISSTSYNSEASGEPESAGSSTGDYAEISSPITTLLRLFQ